MADTSPRQNWLTLGAAAALLGVSESTVRRWADSGDVRSYRTRGGHRRILEDDLRSMLATSSIANASDTIRITDLALARVRRKLSRGRGASRAGVDAFSSLDADSTERLRMLGRQVIELFARIITQGARGDRHAEDARLIGREYGRTLVGASISLSQAVTTFNSLRHTLDETASQIATESGLSTEDAVVALEEVLELTDVILEGIAEVYERTTEVGARR